MHMNSQIVKGNTHGLIVSTMCLVAGGFNGDGTGWGWPKQERRAGTMSDAMNMQCVGAITVH